MYLLNNTCKRLCEINFRAKVTMQEQNKKRIGRILSIVGAIVFVALCTYLVFQAFQHSFRETDALEAVPNNSALVIEIKSPYQLFPKLQDKPYLEDVNALSIINNISNQWEQINKVLKKATNKQPNRVTVAAQIGAKNDLDYIFILSDFDKKFELSLLIEAAQLKNEPQIFDKKTFYKLALDDSTSMSVAQSDKLLIIATSAVLVENVIAQIDQSENNIKQDKSLRKIRELTGKTADLSLYFNMEYIPVFASFFAKEKALKGIQYLQNYAEWIGLDVLFQDKNINLNGYLAPTSKNQLLKALKKQELPHNTLIANVLPDNTAMMTYIGYKNVEAFFKELALANLPDFQEYFVPWLGDEMAYLITEPNEEGFEGHKFAIFKIKNKGKAKAMLSDFGDKVGKLNMEQYFNYTIHRIMANDIIKPVFGEGLNDIQNPYYVIFDDYIVFANAEKGIKELLDKYTYGQTLGEDANYLQFVENLSATSNMYFYINTTNVLNILTAIFNKSLDKSIHDQFEHYQKLTPIGIQLTPYQDLYFVNAQIQYNRKGKQATSVLWKADLEADVAIAPTFVKNHRTNELEIFVQDKNKNIYLFNKNGEEIWRKPLDGWIISDIHQIDFYKNTFLQYLFNTEEKIFLIDRNGEGVQNFPINMNTKITNGIMVADYDTTRDYRYFVACANKMIYGFQGAGELLKGWTGKVNSNIVRFPLQYFNNNGEDYIVAFNEAGELSFYKRNGTSRLDSVSFNSNFNSSFGYDLTEPQRIVVANEEGKAYVVNFEGKFFKLGMNVDNNKDMQFEFMDVVHDARKDYIVLGRNEVGIFSYTKDQEFEGVTQRKFDTPQDTIFQTQLIGQPKKLIGTWSKSTQKAYLLNGAGNLYPDFPIEATTSFQIDDLYNDGKNILIVGNGNAIFAYKLKHIPNF